MSSPLALAYLGVGSNIRPEDNVTRALESLTRTDSVVLTGVSTFYRTAALSDPSKVTGAPDENIGDPDPDFLNGALEISTRHSTFELLAVLARIEDALGRRRPGNRYGPRTIDLDLLLFGLTEKDGSQPIWQPLGSTGFLAHADIEGRPFVALPLMELAPDLTLPPHGTPLRALAATFGSPGGLPETAFTETLRSRFHTP